MDGGKIQFVATIPKVDRRSPDRTQGRGRRTHAHFRHLQMLKHLMILRHRIRTLHAKSTLAIERDDKHLLLPSLLL